MNVKLVPLGIKDFSVIDKAIPEYEVSFNFPIRFVVGVSLNEAQA